jgi:hypothetical protein
MAMPWSGAGAVLRLVHHLDQQESHMDRLMLPELYCPFPVFVNPYEEAIAQGLIDYVRRFNIITDEVAERRLRAVQIGTLLARVYPNMPLANLQLIADWTTWGFIWDDRCGTPELRANPARLAAAQNHFLDVLRGKQPTASDNPMSHGLYDIRRRLLELSSESALEGYIESMVQHFGATEWEATMRAQGGVPDIASYMKVRPFSSGVYTYVEIFEITEGVSFPKEVRAHAILERMTLLATNVVCWINDLLSLSKEIAQGEVQNLVLLLHHHEQIPLQEALDRVVALLDCDVRTFMTLEAQLTSFDASLSDALERYLLMLRSWMSGSLEWSYMSGRYVGAEIAVGA